MTGWSDEDLRTITADGKIPVFHDFDCFGFGRRPRQDDCPHDWLRSSVPRRLGDGPQLGEPLSIVRIAEQPGAHHEQVCPR